MTYQSKLESKGSLNIGLLGILVTSLTLSGCATHRFGPCNEDAQTRENEILAREKLLYREAVTGPRYQLYRFNKDNSRN